MLNWVKVVSGLFVLFLSGCTKIDNETPILSLLYTEPIPVPISIIEDADNKLTIEDILSDSIQRRFTNIEESVLTKRNTTYWLKIDMGEARLKSSNDWVIRASGFKVNNLYYRSGISKSGDLEPISRAFEDFGWKYHKFRGSDLFEDQFLYLEIQETYLQRRITPDLVSLTNYEDYERLSLLAILTKLSENSFWIVFLGGIAFMLFYSLGIYFVFRDNLYLYYTIYLFFSLMYLVPKLFPFLSLQVFGAIPVIYLAWHDLFQILLAYGYLVFVRHFINAKKEYILFNKAARIVEVFYIVLSVVSTFTYLLWPLNTFQHYFLEIVRIVSFLFSVFGTIYILVKLKHRKDLFIIAGSAVLLTGSLMGVFLSNLNYFIFGITFEVFIFALGLGFVMKKREEEKNKLNQEIEVVKARAFRAQMNPHFIFNSLNSIRSFIIKNESDKASEYLADFAELVRNILEYSDEEVISLEEEIEVLKLYMDIEKMRFRNEIEFKITVDPNLVLSQIILPPLIIQPLLENAIWHGLLGKDGSKCIDLRISKMEDDKQIIISVKDNGIGRKASINKNNNSVSKSFGLSITKKRLCIYSQSEDNLWIEDLYDEMDNPSGTRVIIKLPLNSIE